MKKSLVKVEIGDLENLYLNQEDVKAFFFGRKNSKLFKQVDLVSKYH